MRTRTLTQPIPNAILRCTVEANADHTIALARAAHVYDRSRNLDNARTRAVTAPIVRVEVQ